MTTPNKRTVGKMVKDHGFKTVILTGTGYQWQVEITDEGEKEAFMKLFPDIGGFTTGYGSLILRPGYEDKGDWNDKTSRHHY